MSDIIITRSVAEKVLSTVDAGLVSGVGKPIPGQMCVEAAVCYALGLPHGDEPGCVSPALRELKIRLNDSRWSSTAARAKGLRRLALAQLGSRDMLDDVEFSRRVLEMTIRRIVPIALRAAATRNPKHATALETAALECERKGTRESARKARTAAHATAADAYAAADADAADASAAAYTAAYAAAAAAAATYADAAAAAATYADAAAAAAYAADASAYAAAYAAAAADAAHATAAADSVLSQFAEWVVEILIDMQVPGVQWLDLAPKETV